MFACQRVRVRASAKATKFLFFLFLFFFPLPTLTSGDRIRHFIFRSTVQYNQNELQHQHSRWRPSIESRVRSLSRVTFFLFLLRFPCCPMFEECPSVLCFFVQREIPFQRAQHQNPRWRARLEHVQCRLERRTRLKLPYNPFSSRKNRFALWAQATGLALVIAQASCLSACVMRGIEMFGVSFRGRTTISEGFPMSFRRCSDDLPTMFRRCSEDVPKGSRGVLGRRRLFGAFREKRGTSGKVRSAGGAPLPVQGHSSVGCLVLFPPKKFPAL